MARIHRPTIHGTRISRSGNQWCLLLLVLLSICIESFASSAPSKAPAAEVNSTTLVYSTTNGGKTPAPAVTETTSISPEEIIFITSTKEKEARKRQMKPVYYGTPSGEDSSQAWPSLLTSNWRWMVLEFSGGSGTRHWLIAKSRSVSLSLSLQINSIE